MGNKKTKDKLSKLRFHKSKRLLTIIKWLFFAFLIFLTIYFSDFQEITRLFSIIPLWGFVLYILILLFARIMYTLRWKIINDLLLPQSSPNFLVFFSTNLLAEFFSIALPSSLGGEALRYFKINHFNKDGIATTLAIFLDRLVGIISMILASTITLILMNQEIQFSFAEIIPGHLILPVFLVVLVVAVIILYVLIRYMKRSSFVLKIKSAVSAIIKSWKIFLGVLVLSVFSHIVFSISHVVLFDFIHPLPVLSVIGVILTPQLARSIPISLFGVSGGEGLMVFSQLLVGLSQNEAIAITALSLIARYTFALIGLLSELLTDGTKFIKEHMDNQPKQENLDPEDQQHS